jgi:hypothetical protein
VRTEDKTEFDRLKQGWHLLKPSELASRVDQLKMILVRLDPYDKRHVEIGQLEHKLNQRRNTIARAKGETRKPDEY